MSMGVDEAGQDRRVAEVDGARPGGNGHRTLTTYRGDPVLGNDDDAILFYERCLNYPPYR